MAKIKWALLPDVTTKVFLLFMFRARRDRVKYVRICAKLIRVQVRSGEHEISILKRCDYRSDPVLLLLLILISGRVVFLLAMKPRKWPILSWQLESTRCKWLGYVGFSIVTTLFTVCLVKQVVAVLARPCRWCLAKIYLKVLFVTSFLLSLTLWWRHQITTGVPSELVESLFDLLISMTVSHLVKFCLLRQFLGFT